MKEFCAVTSDLKKLLNGINPGICVLLSFLTLLVVPNSMFSQIQDKQDVFVCLAAENKITEKVKILKVNMRAVYVDECRLDFDTVNGWITADIKKYKSEDESIKEFSNDFDFLTLAETYPESVKQLSRRNFWDEAKGYYKRTDSDHLIMLRYKKVNITLISSSCKLIFGIEPLLRTVQFGKFEH